MSQSPSTASGVELSSTRGRLVVSTTVMGSAVAMLTATVVNVALPAIASDLGASAAGQQWVINAYLLTLASLILIGGSLGDRFGRVRVYRIGVLWFGLASLLCAVSPSIEVLIVARFLQGIGGALLTPGSLAIIESTLHKDDRGRGVGLWSGLTGVAAAIGPLIGGLLITASWRWVFLLNLPLAVTVLVMTRWVPETQDASARESRLDWGGAVLTVILLGGVSYGLIQGPASGFSAPVVIVLVAAFVAAVALALYERRRANAMVPLDLFTRREFTAANAMTLLVYGGMGVVFFLLSVQLQVVAGWTPAAAGLALLPVTVLMLTLSSRAGALAQRTGPRWPLTIGPVLIALGMLMMARIGEGAGVLTHVGPAAVVFGLGLAITVAPVTATALGSAPEHRSGAASGANNAVARTGQLLAVAAIPPLVGLSGDGLSDPRQLSNGFPVAMMVAAGMVLAGAAIAFALLRPERQEAATGHIRPDAGDPGSGGGTASPVCCPVDGPPPQAQRRDRATAR